MFIIAGSMISAATWPSRRSSTRSSACASLNGTERVSSVIARGIAGAVGDADRVVAVAERLERRIHGDHHGVVVAVVGALDLEDHVAAGSASRDVDRVHRRLGSRVGEAPLRQPEAPAQLLGDADRVARWEPRNACPARTCRCTASAILGFAWPTHMTPNPLWKSMYSLPSTSQTCAPVPRSTYTGQGSFSWKEDGTPFGITLRARS